MGNVAVTGASGFIGRHVVAALAQAGCEVRACVRGASSIAGAASQVQVRDLADADAAARCTAGVDVVLHLAGSAHHNPAGDAAREAEMRRVNVDGSVALARAAIEAGVRRFVFVSSIGVNGNATARPFAVDSLPAPVDFYAHTKLEAEKRLDEICRGGGMELVIVRPTLVAGPDAPGNLQRLATFIRRGWPLPLLGNSPVRHLVGVRSLSSLLVLACTHANAGGRLFLAADDPALSMPDMAREIATGMQKDVRFLRVPTGLLVGVARLLGRGRDLGRVRDPLLVDASAARELLGWRAPVTVQEELRALGLSARSPSMSRK
jgi:nucleoside-diphosphate-sugar epimerase